MKQYAVVVTIICVVLLIYIAFSHVDFMGAEIQRAEYEQIESDVKAFPKLRSTVSRLLADGKITLREHGEYQAELERVRHDHVVNNLQRQCVIK